MIRLSDMSYQTATSLLLVTALYLTLSSATNESSCSNVQEKLNGLKEAVEALCEGTSVAIPTVRNTWTSVPITSIGSTNLRHPNTFSFVIPSVIPSAAKNVLIYALMHCGTAHGSITLHLKVFTQDGSNKRFEKYLYMLTYKQPAFNTNSDNMWFPMPINRRIYMTVDRDVGANCGAQLYAIGYN
ncbi:uncharacterized protein LOC135342785 isoform X1 [Halichondria panicea]|uniref:uncharacterized protein LOC135342785 isoform X1 n=1 Tax=Halichondria panicea TaxID=6063 RepID=UPI00312B9B08